LSTTILNGGANTLIATFTPTDTANFVSSSSVSNTITVNKKDLVVSISTSSILYMAYRTAGSTSIIYSYSGFITGDNVSSLSGSPDYQVSTNNPQTNIINKSNLPSTAVGSYFINAILGTLASINYNFLFGTVRNFSINRATPTVTITIENSLRTFDYNTPLTSSYFNGLATVKDENGNDVSIPGTFVFNDYNRGIANIGVGYIFNAGNQRIQCSFNPTDTSKYNSGWSNIIDLVINRLTPTITYSIPNNLKTINYGTRLVSGQISASITYNGNPVSAGTITYKPNSTSSSISYNTSSYPNVDTTRIYAIFTDPANNYNSVNTYDTITVNKIRATLTWKYQILQDMAYGMILSNYQLCAQTYSDPNNSAPGNIIYRISSNNQEILLGQTLDVGTYIFNASLIVTNPNYISETYVISNTFTIIKNKPVLTWSNPRNVNQGTTISNTQLNAGITVPNATLTYNPVSGTIMNTTGINNLNVTANYDNSNFLFNSISTSVNMNVL
jgi:hypothetical protein